MGSKKRSLSVPHATVSFLKQGLREGNPEHVVGFMTNHFPDIQESDIEKASCWLLLKMFFASAGFFFVLERWGWCRTSSIREPGLTTQQYRNKMKALLNSVPLFSWKEILCSEQDEEPGSMNCITNYSSYFTSKDWREKEGMIHHAGITWCWSKGPQFQLHSCQWFKSQLFHS